MCSMAAARRKFVGKSTLGNLAQRLSASYSLAGVRARELIELLILNSRDEFADAERAGLALDVGLIA